ncbi:hypothetical protein CEXT_82341 [Caerostris extrusa]|uniref:Uncharacterized protein n=1 Tax=Caerostris extrusa TaxID=172846 RepID=A0AAV4QH20_CAEEX|nr:hypothetical protein CEXT_82341 [Caerostris extrusa]
MLEGSLKYNKQSAKWTSSSQTASAVEIVSESLAMKSHAFETDEKVSNGIIYQNLVTLVPFEKESRREEFLRYNRVPQVQYFRS